VQQQVFDKLIDIQMLKGIRTAATNTISSIQYIIIVVFLSFSSVSGKLWTPFQHLSNTFPIKKQNNNKIKKQK